jgi:YD repeat-containing protein
VALEEEAVGDADGKPTNENDQISTDMKKIIIIALALLTCLSATAQNSSASQEQKMDKKNLVVKEWNANAKGTRTLDHMTIYSPEGRKIEETEYDYTGKQKWRKRFEWNGNGVMTRELLYDERNRLVNYKKFEFNEFGKRKVQYTYDPKGKLISTKTYEYITQDA